MKKILFITITLCFLTTIKGFSQTVYSAAKGEKYHTADCKHSGKAHAIELTKAKKAGKTACEVCKPDQWVKGKLVQCNSKTKEGMRCKRMTANKNNKCFQHQGT